MIRSISRPWIAVACMVGLAMADTLAAPIPVQIHPSPGTQGGPIVIAVLADHFTSGQEFDFNTAAENLFKYGLLTDSYYGGQSAAFTIKTLFEPWTESPTTPASNYGFELGPGVTNCSIHWTPNTSALIEAAVRSSVNPVRTVVIGNHNYNFGCRNGDWMYIAVGAVGNQILEHEMGHLLAGLFDEYAAADLANTKYPKALDRSNCSTKMPPATPYWMTLGLTGITNDLACDLHGQGIVHPYSTCRMGPHRVGFCKVCLREMDLAFREFTEAEPPKPPTNLRIVGAGFFAQPTPPPQPENRSVQVLVNVNRQTGATTVLTVTEVAGPVIPHYRRMGDYVYEISERGNSLAVGVITDDPFETRAYRGGSVPHSSAEDATANILVSIPRATRNTLLDSTRAVEIAFYRLGPQAGNEPVTPARLAALKKGKQLDTVATVPADVLKKMVIGK